MSRYCVPIVTANSRIIAPGFRLDSPGYAQISQNGRYVLISSSSQLSLIDLSTGGSRSFDGAVVGRLADDGSVLLRGRTPIDLVLHRPNGDRLLTTTLPYSSIFIDSVASRIVYWYSPEYDVDLLPKGWALRSIDVATGIDTPLAEGKCPLEGCPPLRSPAIGRNGQQIAYIGPDNRQIFLVTGFSPRPLTSAESYPEGFVEIATSSNGTTLYAVSPSNRILKFDTASGEVAEIVPRSPFVRYSSTPLVPGSMAVLDGFALSEETAEASTDPLPISLAGVSLKIGALNAPILSVAPSAIRFQVPFETPTGRTTIRLPNESPFEQPDPVDQNLFVVQDWNLRFVDKRPDLYPFRQAAIHDDFQSPVTFDHPARPGEVVHLYAVGLGPVSPPVATGQRSSFGLAATLLKPVECWFDDDAPGSKWKPLQIRFAGLAPGEAGLYLISVQLPAAFLPSYSRFARLDCVPANTGSPRSNFILPVVR